MQDVREKNIQINLRLVQSNEILEIFHVTYIVGFQEEL